MTINQINTGTADGRYFKNTALRIWCGFFALRILERLEVQPIGEFQIGVVLRSIINRRRINTV